MQATAKGLRFNLHVTPRTPLLLVGDERHLREILLNLVGNAVKFTEHGGVLVSADGVPDSQVALLRLEVSDTGIGIEDGARTRIFERFTQADETILNRFGGTGLGLAISQQLVRLQGGEITVESTPGKGSTFGFSIPLRMQTALRRRPRMVLRRRRASSYLGRARRRGHRHPSSCEAARRLPSGRPTTCCRRLRMR